MVLGRGAGATGVVRQKKFLQEVVELQVIGLVEIWMWNTP